MKWWERKRREPSAPVVQVRQGKGQPFGALDRYVPLSSGEVELYRAIREGVDRKSTRLNSSHGDESRMPSSA